MTLPEYFKPREDFDRYQVKPFGSKTPEMKEVEQSGYCAWCGKTTVKVSVHHIDCNPRNNHMSNLIPLCNVCHTKYHNYYPNWRYLSNDEIENIIVKGKDILNGSHFRRLVFRDGESMLLESHQYGSVNINAGCYECTEKWSGDNAHISARVHHLSTDHATWIHGDIKLVYGGARNSYKKKGENNDKNNNNNKQTTDAKSIQTNANI